MLMNRSAETSAHLEPRARLMKGFISAAASVRHTDGYIYGKHELVTLFGYLPFYVKVKLEMSLSGHDSLSLLKESKRRTEKFTDYKRHQISQSSETLRTDMSRSLNSVRPCQLGCFSMSSTLAW